MRPVHAALAALPIAVMSSVAMSFAAAADGVATYKDWLIGCDNLKSCTAVGRSGTNDVPGSGYMVVRRDAGPAAAATVTVALYVDGTPPADTVLTLAVDDPKAGILPKPTKTAVDDNGYVRASFDGEAASALVAALRNGNRLQVTPRPGGADAATTVSLAGMSAALLKMDDVQGRVGTVTGLVRPGAKPASAVPAAPTMPVVKAMPLVALAGEPPAAVPRQAVEDTGCSQPDASMGAKLSPSQALWGVCTSAGAYNYFFDFFVVDGGRASPAAFPPPAGGGAPSNELTNPWVEDDGKTLSSFDKGRGIGDCGVMASWAWDGGAFRLVDYAEMGDCFGVPAEDWPVLWRARVQ